MQCRMSSFSLSRWLALVPVSISVREGPSVYVHVLESSLFVCLAHSLFLLFRSFLGRFIYTACTSIYLTRIQHGM